jgi:hypothetical protein
MSKLSPKIEALPEIREARKNYSIADQNVFSCSRLLHAAEKDLIEVLKKHYLGAWWEWEGQYLPSCGAKECEASKLVDGDVAV